MTLLIPYAAGEVITELHELKAVEQTEYTGEGTRLTVKVPVSMKDRYQPYLVPAPSA